jgi:glycosyltransferase involved in cell wall biosynthesis
MNLNDVFVVIAAYNEQKRILKTIRDLNKQGYHNIIVVDDGSQDNTFNLIKNKVYAIKHIINRGQGAALKTGIDFALKRGAKVIITFDADGQHKPSEIKYFLKELEKGYDIVLGSRFIKPKSEIPLHRKILLKGSVIIIRLFYGLKMTDAHNGFRAFSRYAAEIIELKTDRMEHASEFIEEIKKKGLRYKEIPVTILYNKEVLKKGTGSFLEAFRILFRMMFKILTR